MFSLIRCRIFGHPVCYQKRCWSNYTEL